MTLNVVQLIPIAAGSVAILAAIKDVRERRIPNRITYPAMIAGLLLQAAVFGWRGLLSGMEGGLLFGGIFLLFYLVHAMGAGDVKLATALGCIVGVSNVLNVLIPTAVAGALLAIVLMVATRQVFRTLRNTVSVAGFHAAHGLRPHPVVNLDNPTAARMPYGLAFAAGTLYWAIFLNLWR